MKRNLFQTHTQSREDPDGGEGEPEKLKGTSKLRIAAEVVIAVKKEEGNVHDDELARVLKKVEVPKMSIESLKF